MNVQDVEKREVLDYKQFLGKVHDDTYKPFAADNQKDSSDRTGLSTIKREPAFDFVGYADSVFGNKSKIDVPAYRIDMDGKKGEVDAQQFGNVFNMDTSESNNNSEYTFIKNLSDF
jgi:hypothetical protein